LQEHIIKYEPSDLFFGNIDKAFKDLLEYKDDAGIPQYLKFQGPEHHLAAIKGVLPEILSEISLLQNYLSPMSLDEIAD
jgi:hypothetical protein